MLGYFFKLKVEKLYYKKCQKTFCKHLMYMKTCKTNFAHELSFNQKVLPNLRKSAHF